jgi:hypothetical protein
MKAPEQGTDSAFVVTLSSSRPGYRPIRPLRETRGGTSSGKYISPPEYSSLIRKAWGIVSAAKHPEVVKQARRLLLIIQDVIASFEQLGFNLGTLPRFRAVEEEDESVLIEWVFNNFRIGFTIEPNPGESGWYLVSTQALNEVGASGRLSGANMKKNFIWLLNFVISHR